jgi:hypothetical protein
MRKPLTKQVFEFVIDRLSSVTVTTVYDCFDAYPDHSHKQVSTALLALKKRGHVEAAGDVYSITQAGFDYYVHGVKAKRRSRLNTSRTLRHKAWIAMRRKRMFTLSEITMLASAQGLKKDKHNISSFITQLTRAGYLTQIGIEAGVKLTSNGFKRWQLIKDTGELPPFKRGNTMVDRNQGQIMGVQP